jgi:hypothetical protein
MLRLRKRNAEPPAVESAQHEFEAYCTAGRNIEMLLARAPRVAEWCARVLV